MYPRYKLYHFWGSVISCVSDFWRTSRLECLFHIPITSALSNDLLDLARFGVFAGSDLEWIWPISVEFGRSADLAGFFATYSIPIFSGNAPGQIGSIFNRFGRIYEDLADSKS